MRPIRVLIVDDSAVARAVLSRIVAAHDDFEVVGEAGDAEQAIEALRNTFVDIVTLDVEMPGADGLSALPQIIRMGRGARVLIVSSLAEDGAQTAVEALALGAADTIPKPGGGRVHGGFAQVLLSKMRLIGHARPHEKTVTGATAADPGSHDARLLPASREQIRCLAIGASTGGLHALARLFDALPKKIGVPILVTQHLPAVFIPFFTRQLALLTGRAAEVACDDDGIVADRILVAPGDGHLIVAPSGNRLVVRIDRTGPVGGCLPAVDPMFGAVADHYGASACAVVLTGMGRDGSAGAARLAQRGATILVQDAASSAVWGMPRSVAEAGHASAILDPVGIARRIAARTGAAQAGAAAWK